MQNAENKTQTSVSRWGLIVSLLALIALGSDGPEIKYHPNFSAASGGWGYHPSIGSTLADRDPRPMHWPIAGRLSPETINAILEEDRAWRKRQEERKQQRKQAQ